MNPEVLVPGEGDQVLSRRGMTLGRDVFQTMRREFYELRGWDAETGFHRPETLERLSLTDLLAPAPGKAP